MLSSSICSATCSSFSSQTFYDCYSCFSIPTLDFDSVSQIPAEILPDICTLPRVSLPSVDRHFNLAAALRPPTENTTVPKGQEEPQTVRKLVLRKRTTSPYQIKLPSMNDRLRVRNGRLVIHAETTAKPAITAKRTPDLKQTARTAIRTSSCPDGPSNDNLPAPLHPPSIKWPVDGPREQPFTCHPNPLSPSIIRAADTWSEICEDLCRAMEILSVLSDLDASSPGSSPSFTAASLDCSTQSYSVAISPGFGDHWDSYVFPRVVV